MFPLGENQIQQRWSSSGWMLVRRWNTARPCSDSPFVTSAGHQTVQRI